jgi:hypothetical protein
MSIRYATIYTCDRCGGEAEAAETAPPGWLVLHLRQECDSETCAHAREVEAVALAEYEAATEKARTTYEKALTAAEKKRALAVASLTE